MYFNSQNLNEKPGGRKGSMLLHGRCWWKFGRRDGSGDTKYMLEWRLGSKSCRASANFNGPDDHNLMISVCLPPVALYFGVRSKLVSRWFKGSYKDRELELAIHSWAIWWNLWTPSMEWSCETPRWRNGSFHFLRFLSGKDRFEKRLLSEEPALVPMPERPYKAVVRLYECTWRRARWFPKRQLRADVDLNNDPIGIPGKGENSWDCGDDATYSLWCLAGTVESAIAQTVESCLKTRRKYGGRNWTPPDKAVNVPPAR